MDPPPFHPQDATGEVAAQRADGGGPILPRQSKRGDVKQASQLRGAMSLPEVLLWRLLKQQDEIKLRRQHAIGPYVLDFYCLANKVCFEIDAMAHNMGDRPARDGVRDAWLAAQGIEVVRIAAIEVLRCPQEVAEAIVARCRQ